MPKFQKTIRKGFSLTGRTSQLGTPVTLEFKQAQPGTGIVFERNGKRIPANSRTLQSGGFLKNSVLGWSSIAFREGKTRVSTAEHLMAALKAGGVDNCVVRINGRNVPRFAESTKEYIEMLQDNKLRQDTVRRKIVVNFSRSPYLMSTSRQLGELREILAKRGIPQQFFDLSDRKPCIVIQHPNPKYPDLLIIRPAKGFVISSGFGYFSHKALSKTQFHRMEVNLANYQQQLMEARTLAFPGIKGHLARPFLKLGEIKFPKGFRLHGIDAETAVLAGKKSNAQLLNDPQNPKEKVRYADEEIVRHKQMDLLGVLAAFPGHFQNIEIFAFKPSHKFLIESLQKLQQLGIISF